MKELVFIDNNNARWKQFENILNSHATLAPDKVSDLFIQITDDLSYARTYYPKSRVIPYLNSLAIKVHHTIYRNKKVKTNRFAEFWLIDYPLLVRENRRFIIYSLFIFIVAMSVGYLSALNDNTFTRMILGDEYVNRTIEFINKGDPMAVYKQSGAPGMFLAITTNNIMVAIKCVLYGIFFSLGTALALISNGIMVGAFQEFFMQHHLLKESILAIYIHGTFELFSIVVSGAAGFMIGAGIMFPGSHSRLESFIAGVQKAVHLLIGIIPLFIVAGFLEGFITRLTYLPDMVRASIILTSFLIIVFYFFIYPTIVLKKLRSHGN